MLKSLVVIRYPELVIGESEPVNISEQAEDALFVLLGGQIDHERTLIDQMQKRSLIDTLSTLTASQVDVSLACHIADLSGWPQGAYRRASSKH